MFTKVTTIINYKIHAIMNLQDYVAKTAKKIFQVNKENGNTIGVFRDTKEKANFYCVVWVLKNENNPKLKFYKNLEDAIRVASYIIEII